METKREVWLLRTGFGITPVNKLVSLTWLLWALSFRNFTLHYILHILASSYIMLILLFLFLLLFILALFLLSFFTASSSLSIPSFNFFPSSTFRGINSCFIIIVNSYSSTSF